MCSYLKIGVVCLLYLSCLMMRTAFFCELDLEASVAMSSYERGALTRESPRGSGFLNGKQMGNRWGGMEMIISVYEQPGTRVDGSYHSKEGSK
jgi:hypothetical protein